MPKPINQLNVGERIVNRLPLRKERQFDVKGVDQRLLADVSANEQWEVIDVNATSHPLWVKLSVPYSHGTRNIIFSGAEYSSLFK